MSSASSSAPKPCCRDRTTGRGDAANFLSLNAYFTSIGGGTDQIQRNIIGESRRAAVAFAYYGEGVVLARLEPLNMSTADQPHADVVHPHAVPFIVVHLACLAAFWTGVTWQALALCVGLYWLRIFAIGAGYHRYFSHRSFSTSRVFQFVLAFLAQTTAQNSVLWWAALHRRHHLYSDTMEDTHSPRRRGFFYAHVGWIFDPKHAKADLSRVEDPTRYPSFGGWPSSSWRRRSSQALPAGLWPGGRAWWWVSSGARCWSTTPPSASTRWPTCTASAAMTGDDSRNNCCWR